MKIEIEPINKQVVLQVIEEEEDGPGFIIPEQVRKKRLAKVIAVGPNVEQVNTGDDVAFRPQLVQDVELGGEKFLVAEEGSLLCIIRKRKDE